MQHDLIDGSHIFGLKNFPDISSIFPIFQYFSVFYLNYKKYKNLFNKYTSIKHQRKNKYWLKFLHFSSILCKIFRLFQSVQNSPTGNVFPFFQSMTYLSNYRMSWGLATMVQFSKTTLRMRSHLYLGFYLKLLIAIN